MLQVGGIGRRRLSCVRLSWQCSGRRSVATHTRDAPSWRPPSVLDDWVDRPIRYISLRQLFFFGRTLTKSRLINSANYVREELPTRLAHRLREMQKLPYVVVTNPHIGFVYELYYKAFDSLRRIPMIRTVEDNDNFCNIVRQNLEEHLAVIPHLVVGALQCQEVIVPKLPYKFLNDFVHAMLRARISRRVIAEQHLTLSETFNSPFYVTQTSSEDDFVGNVLLRCKVKDVIKKCGVLAQNLYKSIAGPDLFVPEIVVRGDLEATFPYVLSHLEYIVGEILRNSVEAVMQNHHTTRNTNQPPPIEVFICESAQHVIIRFSDRGGGMPNEILPFLSSFTAGPRSALRLQNLSQVRGMAATIEELQQPLLNITKGDRRDESLSALSSRPPNLRLGLGLPMSKVYAEYWAGGLDLQSLPGYGTDAFLQISKIGNQNEQLTTRANIDSV